MSSRGASVPQVSKVKMHRPQPPMGSISEEVPAAPTATFFKNAFIPISSSQLGLSSPFTPSEASDVPDRLSPVLNLHLRYSRVRLIWFRALYVPRYRGVGCRVPVYSPLSLSSSIPYCSDALAGGTHESPWLPQTENRCWSYSLRIPPYSSPGKHPVYTE